MATCDARHKADSHRRTCRTTRLAIRDRNERIDSDCDTKPR
jgi:hypothetical protein